MSARNRSSDSGLRAVPFPECAGTKPAFIVLVIIIYTRFGKKQTRFQVSFKDSSAFRFSPGRLRLPSGSKKK